MTARRRASQTRQNPFAAGFGVPAAAAPAVPVDVEPEPPAADGGGAVAAAAQPDKPAKPPTSKFTANLDPETAAAFDELALIARRKLVRRVDKLDILKVLVMLAADDVSLRDQVLDELGKRA